MHAGAIMTADPATVAPDTLVGEALRLLHERDCRHLPVVEDGELIGMVSDRDLRGLFVWDPDGQAFVGSASAAFQTPVSRLMTGDVVSVTPEAELDEVVEALLEHRVGALPVVDETSGDLVGIISYVDVLRAVRDGL